MSQDDKFEPEDYFKGNYKKPEKECPIVTKNKPFFDAFDYFVNGLDRSVWDLEVSFDLPKNEETSLSLECIHEPIDVGFAIPKMVCKKCDKDL